MAADAVLSIDDPEIGVLDAAMADLEPRPARPMHPLVRMPSAVDFDALDERLGLRAPANPDDPAE